MDSAITEEGGGVKQQNPTVSDASDAVPSYGSDKNAGRDAILDAEAKAVPVPAAPAVPIAKKVGLDGSGEPGETSGEDDDKVSFHAGGDEEETVTAAGGGGEDTVSCTGTSPIVAVVGDAAETADSADEGVVAADAA